MDPSCGRGAVRHDKLAEYMQLIRPLSMASFALAIAAVAVATLARSLFTYAGATLPFATYFPAILVVSVFAGAPAGCAAALLSLLLAWWAFIPPYFAFLPIITGDIANLVLYLVAAVLIIYFSHLYRSAVAALLDSQESQAMLVDELNHRAGNLLTVIQSIVRGTLTSHGEDASKLSRRLEALARADDLVSRNGGGPILLSSLLERELTPHAHSQIALSGPDVWLRGSATRNVALIIHELATNAAKYGALSSTRGKLDVSWTGMNGTCRMIWHETNCKVREPTKKGFGSRIIAASTATLKGTFDEDFSEDGYSCVLSFPSARAGSISRSGNSSKALRAKWSPL